jgi:cobalamin synthase
VATSQKKILFAKIETREDALKTVKDASIGFFAVAVLQALLATFIAPSLYLDAAILAVLAGALWKWNSRLAAVLLVVVSGGEAVVTVLNRLGVMAQGGKNVILAFIMLVVAIRAVEATYKLAGNKFPMPRPTPRAPSALPAR